MSGFIAALAPFAIKGIIALVGYVAGRIHGSHINSKQKGGT